MRSCLSPAWPAPQNVHALTTTRQTNLAELSLPHAPILLDQVHGIEVVQAETLQPNTKADAVYTTHKNRVCAVKTADCLPVLISDPQGSCVAAVHAGWRGLAAGIIENTVNHLPVNKEELLVWFGPAIGPTAFEVGEEVREAFMQHSREAANAFRQATQKDKWFADLFLLARQRLNALGVNNIYGGGECTYTNQDKYYSYRRDKDTGRIFSIIWIE
jgi:YfiH family protein